MKKKTFILSLFLFLLVTVLSIPIQAQQVVQKTNPMKVYMHYMPWFETPETIGRWGWHWTMNTRNPNTVDANGHRQIASHYYPLIGPYASRDKDVIEYHLLLMKLSGIDGVLINWYGVAGSNGDINDLLKSSDSLVSYTDDFGLQFGVVMEDRFSRTVDDVKANMDYLKNNYFTKPEYIRYGTNSTPLVCIFGPITFQQASLWTDIMPSAGEELEFLTLWYESGEAGTNADGEFSWVYQDNQNHLTHLQNFYQNRAPSLKTSAGSIYPGFNDYYLEGGSGNGYFTIPHDNGNTLNETIKKAEQYKNVVDMVQLVTFNDFGEGTMIEPTLETGYTYLERIQEYTGVTYGETELKLVYRLFVLRKDYAGNPQVQDSLNDASHYLRNLQINEAALILNAIPPLSLLEKIKENKGNDTGLQLFPNPYKGGKIDFGKVGNPQNITGLTIMDVFGKRVFEYKFEKGTPSNAIDDLDLPAGIYVVLLQNGNARGIGKLVFTEH